MNKELTFIIPVRIDSIIRMENLIAVISFIMKIGAQIIVCEATRYNNMFIRRILPKYSGLHYMFIEDFDPVFHRTHYLNIMTKACTTPYVAIWDADVVVDKLQIIKSLSVLSNGDAEVSFPYNGNLLDTGKILREQYLQKKDIRFLIRHQNYMNMLYSGNSVGGGIIVNRIKYIEAGMENENFYGWGPEDLERVKRWVNLGYRIHRANGPMFHLSHPRDMNGSFRTSLHQRICEDVLSISIHNSSDDILNKNLPL